MDNFSDDGKWVVVCRKCASPAHDDDDDDDDDDGEENEEYDDGNNDDDDHVLCSLIMTRERVVLSL